MPRAPISRLPPPPSSAPPPPSSAIRATSIRSRSPRPPARLCSVQPPAEHSAVERSARRIPEREELPPPCARVHDRRAEHQSERAREPLAPQVRRGEVEDARARGVACPAAHAPLEIGGGGEGDAAPLERGEARALAQTAERRTTTPRVRRRRVASTAAGRVGGSVARRGGSRGTGRVGRIECERCGGGTGVASKASAAALVPLSLRGLIPPWGAPSAPRGAPPPPWGAAPPPWLPAPLCRSRPPLPRPCARLLLLRASASCASAPEAAARLTAATPSRHLTSATCSRRRRSLRVRRRLHLPIARHLSCARLNPSKAP